MFMNKKNYYHINVHTTHSNLYTEDDGAMGISSHLPPLGEGLPRGKPPERQKENKGTESWIYGKIWAPRYSHAWEHPLDFWGDIFHIPLEYASIFPFLHKPFWVEFLPHSTEAPARYDKLLPSKAQLVSPPHKDPTNLCSLTGGPFFLCSAMITYASTWPLAWDLLESRDLILIHGHILRSQMELNKQWMN